MRANARGVDFFKEINGHPQVDIADTLDGKPYRVFTRIEHAILAGTVVLKFQQIISVFQCEYVFCFPVDQFVFHFSSPFLFLLLSKRCHRLFAA